MATTDLLIVESPNKIKKLKSILPPHFAVESSVGHIRGINRKGICIDINNEFKPEYVDLEDKGKVIANLRKCAKGKQCIWIATDPDREGEGIAWHIAEVLKLPKSKYKRVAFGAITKKDVLDAISKPTDINMDTVNAYQARSVIDKLIGYLLSPLLHKNFNDWHLSAGRVQSAVLRLVVEREVEIKAFQTSNVFHCKALFTPNMEDKHRIDTTLDNDITEETKLNTLLDAIKDKKTTYPILSINNKETKRKPQPPYTTMSLQQDASNKLGMSPKATMSYAQNLFANGYITYMRTDSISLAEEALNNIITYVKNEFGDKYANRIQYKTRDKNAQEGHEACRPTTITRNNVNDIKELSMPEKRLYKMIWQRTIASQMTPADVEIHTLKVGVDSKITKPKDYTFIGKAEKILFDGFLAIYNKTSISATSSNSDDNDSSGDSSGDSSDEDKDNTTTPSDKKENENIKLIKIFSKLNEKDTLYLQGLDVQEKPTKPKNGRYTEATLIKQLKNLGIARPSTITGMITTIQDRKYVVKKTISPKEKEFRHIMFKAFVVKEDKKKLNVDGERNVLYPTPLGCMINEFLQASFNNIINYTFTADVEVMLDDIDKGKKVWHNIVKIVYDKFNPKILELSAKIKSEKASLRLESSESGNKYSSDVVLLGVHPTKNVDVILIPKTKMGPAICLNYEEKEMRIYVNFSGKIDKMTFETAIKLLDVGYPRQLGKYEENEIYIKKASNIYLSYNGKNYSIDAYNNGNSSNMINPETIDYLDAIKVIKYSKTNDVNKNISDDITITKGPFGFYIKYKGKSNIPIPKKQRDNALSLTKDEVETIVDKHLQNDRNKAKIEKQLKSNTTKDKTTKTTKATKTAKTTKDKEPKTSDTKRKAPVKKKTTTRGSKKEEPSDNIIYRFDDE
jgi:DNA topoisomerase I